MRPAMSDIAPLLRQQLSLRGRCNRHGFLVVALVLMGVQFVGGLALHAAGADLHGTLALALNLPVFAIGYAAVMKRLHDVGRSGWWMPGMFALWIVTALIATTLIGLFVGPDRLAAAAEAKSVLFWLIIAIVAVPAFGGLVWLHTAPGEPTANRFGAVPGPSGFAVGPARSRRPEVLPIGAVPAG